MTDLKSQRPTASTRPSPLDPELMAWMPRVRRRGTVFLDYDGTLTPIVERPELAVLSEEVREVLGRLSQLTPVTIVSGRDAEVVRTLVALDKLGYVGSHGLDIVGPAVAGPRLRLVVGTEFLGELDVVEEELRRRAGSFAGVLIERKRFSISTHVRQATPADRPAIEAIVDELRLAHPTLRREGGKLLYELRPDVDWDKGRAVRWLLDGLGRDSSDALYVGDDLTDETAFVALDAPAPTVVVADTEGDRPTAARFWLRGPDDVLTLLQRLASTPLDDDV